MRLSTILKTINTYHNWPLYYAWYFGISHRQQRIKLRNGLSFYVDPAHGDFWPLNDVYMNLEYLPALKHLKANSSIVIDVGAHIGSFSLQAARYSSQIFAYEPDPRTYNLLKTNIHHNKLPYKIKSYNIAFSNSSGKKNWFYSHKGSQGNTLVSSEQFTKTQTEVNCTTLSEEMTRLKLPKIDLLKLDCEGSEFKILSSLSKQDFQKISSIIFEYHDDLAPKHLTHRNLIKLLSIHHFTTISHIKTSNTRGLIFVINQ